LYIKGGTFLSGKEWIAIEILQPIQLQPNKAKFESLHAHRARWKIQQRHKHYKKKKQQEQMMKMTMKMKKQHEQQREQQEQKTVLLEQTAMKHSNNSD
jgi:hypothetical protein